MPADQLVYHRFDKGHPNQVMSPQTVALNFTGDNAAASGLVTPPDSDGGVGPTQFLVAVNGRIRTYNKSTGVIDGALNASSDAFFTTVENGSSTSDPMVRYDRLTSRWFITMVNVPATQNRILLAVSDAASNGTITATTVWTFFFFQNDTVTPTISNTCFADYPSLGVDANALYVGVDDFCQSPQIFQQTDGFVIRKSSVLGAGPIVVTAFRGLMSGANNFIGPYAPRGVDNFDPNSTQGYFIGTDGNSYGTLRLVRIGDPGGTPYLQGTDGITVPATDGPVLVPNSGNATSLDPLDDRLFEAHIRNGQLWTAHNIAVNTSGVVDPIAANNNRDGSRWYQINVPAGAGTPTVVQSGTVFSNAATNPLFYWIPSIMVSGQGHAAMGFSTCGNAASTGANAATVGRLATDPLGTMETPIALTTATSQMTFGDGLNPHRWGDYSITSVDPIDDMTLWTIQEFDSTTGNVWNCRVAKLRAPKPATPSILADIPVGASSFSVTLTGTSSAGTGFFDPGANLASPARPFNHLAAAITANGATGTPPSVVSATYVDPTHINFVLNAAAATANIGAQKYTLTITNPDTQTVVTQIVHVVQLSILSSAGAGGSISPNGVTNESFGANQTYTITPNSCFHIVDVQVDGGSVGAVASYTFSNIQATHTIAATFAQNAITAVSGLGAAQVKSGNDADGTTKITLSFTPGSGTTEVWRKGFGGYPLYDDGGGSVPAAPGAYPPAGWTLTGVTSSGQTDEPATRDFWYYVAYSKDACGNASAASNLTGGTLNYHLGDVSDGITPGQGNNTVAIEDVSLLGAHYGASGAGLAGFEYLDVGPTTDNSTNGRPTTDNKVGFDDLLMFALNYTPNVSIVANKHPMQPAMADLLSVDAPMAVNFGDTFDVPVHLAGAGDLQGVSVALGWNASIVTPTGVTAGDLVTSEGGVVMSAGPGQLDAALLGAGRGLAGDGPIATVHFRAVGQGSPDVAIAHAFGRSTSNQNASIAIQNPLATGSRVTATELFPAIPNPTTGATLIQYALATRAPVDLSVYSVDGRRVKTLAHGVQGVGRYQFNWNGTDERGTPTKSGVFFIRLDVPGMRKTRLLTVVR